jgi:peptidoglycan hydrolase-like protein with peptidoglycan-binding domain
MGMNRVTWHHTGGGYRSSDLDRRAYHAIVEGDGSVTNGDFTPEDNQGRLQRGRYAAHTAGLNTGNYGIALACMADGQWSQPRASKFFPRLEQIDAMLQQTVWACRRWSITPSRQHTLSHAEVAQSVGVPQQGKWDFDYDPWGRRDSRNAIAIGDELRQEVVNRLGVKQLPKPAAIRPRLSRGSTGIHVRYLQERLGIDIDGQFGPDTYIAVVTFQDKNELKPDGIVGNMTWEALG